MTVLVIGAGPAGLMAAEVISAAGIPVTVAEAMPTPARKFLMAGKSGLNLTKDQPAADFAAHFAGSCAGLLGIADFGPPQVRAWAGGLGVPLFTGTTGRVFPVGMKASPLLRAWLARLAGQGVRIRPRWRWTGAGFDTPDGSQQIAADAVVLALGGASWPRLGSDGAWQGWLAGQGVGLAPMKPANMGFRAAWSDQMARHFGAAVKGTAIRAGDAASRGEWVISQTGIEGGGIYEIAAGIRDGAAPFVDLAPDLERAELARRLARAPAKLSLGNRLRRVLGDPVRAALLMEWGRPLPADPAALAGLAKALPMRLTGPMGIARAISSAGGITADALTPALELRAMPGTFAAGEMLDWEAPTGGYLLTGCLASGRTAGRGVLDYLSRARR
ncbi:TIGR03862 family flavoprotein [Paracoccus sp. DMF-8]|uniref:TIGR03862 family flavoprotein n=1 Tax=Paracoccus sp. DMF-8 TaxID=3019445 RepID=UPI0023E8C3DC|nr:TIGR03862 family flavoprotein [Paracoccus sp. DMF-8]MDF3605219.1 TIGR03862 family flavoprotein [Paracoccus sp. DMF-8]